MATNDGRMFVNSGLRKEPRKNEGERDEISEIQEK